METARLSASPRQENQGRERMEEGHWTSQAKQVETRQVGGSKAKRVCSLLAVVPPSLRGLCDSLGTRSPKAEGLCGEANIGQADEHVILPGLHSGPFREKNS